MRCNEVRLLMRLWVEGGLSNQLAVEMDRHVWLTKGGCKDCQSEYDERFPVAAKPRSFWEEDGSWCWNTLLDAAEKGSEEASAAVARVGRAMAEYTQLLRQKSAVRSSHSAPANVKSMPEYILKSTSLRAYKGSLEATVQILNPKQLPALLVFRIDAGNGERAVSWNVPIDKKGLVEAVVPGFPHDLLSIDWPHVAVSMRYSD
jgi:hypothetical protein